MLHDIFGQIGLKITAQVNNQIVNFLDITLDLENAKFAPYRKPNNQPLYVDSRSNHPPSILKQIPISINKRISSLSSDQESFDECKPFYESALKHSNYTMFLWNIQPTALLLHHGNTKPLRTICLVDNGGIAEVNSMVVLTKHIYIYIYIYTCMIPIRVKQTVVVF